MRVRTSARAHPAGPAESRHAVAQLMQFARAEKRAVVASCTASEIQVARLRDCVRRRWRKERRQGH